jgi:hypothetical protein
VGAVIQEDFEQEGGGDEQFMEYWESVLIKRGFCFIGVVSNIRTIAYMTDFIH